MLPNQNEFYKEWSESFLKNPWGMWSMAANPWMAYFTAWQSLTMPYLKQNPYMQQNLQQNPWFNPSTYGLPPKE